MNVRVAQDVEAEPDMSPEVRIGGREADDHQERAPDGHPKDRCGWKGTVATAREREAITCGDHGPGNILVCAAAVIITGTLDRCGTVRPKTTDWSSSYRRRQPSSASRCTTGSFRGIQM